MKRLTPSYLLAVLIFAGFLYFSFREVSRMLVLYFAVTNYFALLLIRLILTLHLRSGKSGIQRLRVLIVGATGGGMSLATALQADHGSAYHLVGFVDDAPNAVAPLPAMVLGGTGDLGRLVYEHAIDLVLIALPDFRFMEAHKLTLDLCSLPVRVYLVPDVFKLALIRAEVETFANVPLIGLREPVIQGYRRTVKRSFDLVAATVGLALVWPAMVIIWIAVKLDSPGAGLFSTDRIGENGKPFKMLKFRSMVTGGEQLQACLTTRDDQGRPIYKSRDDPRVTRIGGFLRRWSLDELPQLLNVIRGEMSLVGPRPEQPFITKNYDSCQWQRFAVPPGMTGWWQVMGRSDIPLHLNSDYDNYYVRNHSLTLDLKILLKTVVVVIQGRGAY